MDEERKLVSELQGKLAELDQKVWQYGKDMAAEFERHKERILRDVPKELSETVSKAIATSMKDYKALYPVPAGTNESGLAKGINNSKQADDTENNAPPEVYTGPKPIAFRPSTLEPRDDSQHSRSPHARDEEFMGIITPSFLPLLGDSRKERRESDERRASLERRRSIDSSQPSVPALKRTESLVDASTSTRSPTTTPEDSRPPVPSRRNTDEASVASDLSESTFPRSALRRSSNSSMKASPRRVRFDFEGTEVLPTSSPLPAPSVIAEGIYDSDDDEPGSQQVENIEEEEESPPLPKRISSSQKLRALSRQPLDEDDTIWTAVSAPDDGSPSIETASAPNVFSSGINEGINKLRLASPVIPSQQKMQDGVQISADDNDLPLDDMPEFNPIKGRTPILPASILSPINQSSIEGSDSPASPSRTPRPTWKTMHSFDEDNLDIGQGMRFDDDDQEELFDFDENTHQRSPPEEPQDDSSDKDNSSTTPSPTFQTESNPLFSRSPARPIFRPTAPEPSQATASLVSSFKRNHPFSMPIVSEAIHAQAASMGPVDSFVGSMTGRTGLDESNVASYRATGGIGSFTGGQSMTERMYMDDWKDEQAALKSKPKN